MNNLSKDYELLYSYLILGKDAFCLVNYNFYRNNTEFYRDVCRCRKQEHGIEFSSRGICYGSVYPFEVKKDKGTEKELFLSECKRLDVEFIIIENNQK